GVRPRLGPGVSPTVPRLVSSNDQLPTSDGSEGGASPAVVPWSSLAAPSPGAAASTWEPASEPEPPSRSMSDVSMPTKHPANTRAHDAGNKRRMGFDQPAKHRPASTSEMSVYPQNSTRPTDALRVRPDETTRMTTPTPAAARPVKSPTSAIARLR